jgi:hypothetical protein
MTPPCFECGKPSQYEHYVVPKSRGGRKTVPLCGRCHALALHSSKKKHGQLIKEGLARARARGVKIGRPENLTHAGQLKGGHVSARASVRRAVEEMSDVWLIAARMKAEGYTLRAIAAYLDREGFVTRQGKSWSAVQVKRVLDRHPIPGGEMKNGDADVSQGR